MLCTVAGLFANLSTAADLWEISGYGDILQKDCNTNILRKISFLREIYKLSSARSLYLVEQRNPLRRKKMSSRSPWRSCLTSPWSPCTHQDSSQQNIVSSYYTTGTRPLALHGTRYTTKLQVEKKVARKEKRRNISSANITSQPSTTLDPSSGISISPELLVIWLHQFWWRVHS